MNALFLPTPCDRRTRARAAILRVEWAGIGNKAEHLRNVRWNILRGALRHAIAFKAGRHRPISDFERRQVRACLAQLRGAK